MITLKKNNIEKIVTSQDEARKLVLRGFIVVSEKETAVIPQTASTVFVCSVCGKEYKARDYLEKHMAKKHSSIPSDNKGGEAHDPDGKIDNGSQGQPEAQ